LPRNANVQIDLIASKSAKQTLHVQSISFWAAANIGPYAQASAVGNVVFIAGQIGLVPNTMELSESLNDQIETSLFNLEAINREMKSSPFGAVCYITDSEAYSQVYSEWNDRSLLLTVSCSGLPRSALVEWQTLSLKNLRVSDINTQEIGKMECN
jgi:diphthine-ammonia ligase